MTLLVLIFAHLVADYPLQGDFLAKMKGSNFLLLMTHCGIWCGCVFIAAHFCGLHPTRGMVFLQFTVHLVADFAKANGFYGKADPLGWPLWADQGIHLLQLMWIAS